VSWPGRGARCLAFAAALLLVGCDLEGYAGDVGASGGGARDAGDASAPLDAGAGADGSFGRDGGSADRGAPIDGGTDGGDDGAPTDAGADGGASADAGSDGGAPADGGSPADASGVGNPRRVLLCDEGNMRLHLLDLENPGPAVWSKPLDGMRDIQLVGGDRVAVSIAKGYVELDLKTGATKKEVGNFAGVESIRRLPNGNTVLGANASGGVTLQELDSQDAPIPGHKVTFASYGQFRTLRRTPQGTFLIGVGTKLAEVNWNNQTLWEMDIPGGSSVYQGLRLSDGTLAVASGYGAAILVIDPASKKVLTTIGGKAQPDAGAIVPNFYAGFQVLPNGHFVVTNWEGHGNGNGSKGFQLLEYDASGLLVWKWKQDPNLVSSLHGVIVLDGLDTTKLHDEVNGVLAPVTQ
jgi:hypothetical protein